MENHQSIGHWRGNAAGLKEDFLLSLQIIVTRVALSYTMISLFKSQSPFPRPMAHRAAPISVSIALGHASVNAARAIAGGWSTGSSASLNFPLHSHMSSARREGSEYHF